MHKDEKVALLRRLLARVQTNASERRDITSRDTPSFRLAPPELRTREVELPFVDTAPSPLTVRDPDGEAALPLDVVDTWASLDPTEAAPPSRIHTLRPPPLAPPSPSERPARAPTPVPAPDPDPDPPQTTIAATPAIALVDPPEAAIDSPPLAASIETEDRSENDDASSPDEPESSSELERALQLAIRDRSLDPRDPKAIWEGAVHGLRERRTTARPPPEPDEPTPEPDLPPPPLTPSELAPDGLTASVRSPRGSAPPSRKLRRRLFRPTVHRAKDEGPSRSTRLWIGVVLVSAAGAMGIAASFIRGRAPTSSTTTSELAPPVSSIAMAPAISASDRASPSASSSASPAPRPPIPDARTLPEGKGFLFVESAPGRPVYVNGVLAGDTAEWLTVSCGFRHVRLAERGPSTAGKSFPSWATDGVSVLVPCHGATEAALP